MKSIAKEIEKHEVEICRVCGENPQREGLKTCSKECSRKYKTLIRKTKEFRAYRNNYMKAYNKTYNQIPRVKARIREYQKAYKKKKQITGTLTIHKNDITEQQIVENSLMKHHAGYDYKVTLLFYALAKSWHRDKLFYYLKLIEGEEK